MLLSCQELEPSTKLSKERLDRAINVFGESVVKRFICFALYLIGIKRSSIAKQLIMPTETVKTVIKNLHNNGIPAFEDRRYSTSSFLPKEKRVKTLKVKTSLEWIHIDLGAEQKLKIPLNNKLQVRTILLTLLSSGLLSTKKVAELIGLSNVQTKSISKKLEREDISSLLDKRQGQKKDYVIGSEIKAELIQQFAVNAAIKRNNSSQALADDLNKRCNFDLSSRTIRYHIDKLGLSKIKQTLPKLIDTFKKNSKIL